MNAAKMALPLIATSVLFGQGLPVEKSAIWIETVQQGDLPVSVRAAGVLTSRSAAELKVPEILAKALKIGQSVSIEASPALLNGRINRLGSEATNGALAVGVELETPAPDSVQSGAELDGVIHVTTLKNVAYIGRPVSCQPNGEGILFKLDPGGQTASRVKVLYGQFGHTPAKVVEIRGGLAPGDKVIVTDMSAHAGEALVRLR